MVKRNPFANRDIAGSYEDWYHTLGKRVADQEKQLIRELLNQFTKAYTILEIGCGTGFFMSWLRNLGNEVYGIDLSRQMIDRAHQKAFIDCVQADGSAVPFPSKSFGLVLLITSLEFVSDPIGVLSEAFRVAKQGVVLGVLNRHSLVGYRYRLQEGQIWKEANFFTPSELKRLLSEITRQPIDVAWKTTLWPLYFGALKLPWGGFIGMSIKLSATAGS